MPESVFLFARQASGDDGAPYTQSALVYAPSLEEAEVILREATDEISAEPQDPSAPTYSGSGWVGEGVALDQSKVISLVSTRWPAGE